MDAPAKYRVEVAKTGRLAVDQTTVALDLFLLLPLLSCSDALPNLLGRG